jgi:flagellar biosynthesis protein FlhB
MAQPGRNLPPTRKKLQDARKRGDVPRFRDAVCFASLAAGCAALVWILPGRAQKLFLFAKDTLSCAGQVKAGEMGAGMVYAWGSEAGRVWLGAALSVMIPVSVMTLAAAFLTTGPVFSIHPVSPRLDRLNPLQGARRMVSSERWFGLLKDLLKLGLLALGGFFVVREILGIIPAFLQVQSAGGAAVILLGIVKTCFKYTLLSLAPIILIDLIYSRSAYMKKMMMTREELKKELKETEGDPSIKGRRQKLHREIALQRMIEDVRKATVVIVNPEHIAVALQWDEETMDAPTVVAGGKEHLAERIIREARRCGVPVIQDVVLAHSLADLQPGEEIPENLYEAVAKIIRLLQGG